MPSRNGKLRLLEDYFRAVPDPDRGYGLAALTGGLDLPHAKPAMIRDLAMSRVDPELFALSYDYVGDLAETVALIWPTRPGANRPPDIATEIGRASCRESVSTCRSRWSPYPSKKKKQNNSRTPAVEKKQEQ